MLQRLTEYRELSLSKKIFVAFMLLALMAVSYLYFQNAKRLDPLGDFPFYTDDTFIHLRFAHHLANGDGFIWNIGAEPVEGSTSFLYVLIIALIEKTGIQPIWTLPYLASIFSILLLVNTFILLQILNPDNLLLNLTATVMLALFPPIMTWINSGLEVMLYAFAILFCATLYVLYRRGSIPAYIVGFAFAITALIRPECLLLFGVTAAYDLGTLCFSGRKDYKPGFVLIMTFLLIYLPVFLWKWNYFGYPFPNTYYAKTGGGLIQLSGGISYLATQLTENFIPAVLLGLLYVVALKKDAYFYEKSYLLLLLLASWLIVMINGGDYMGEARFLTPTISFLYILGGTGLAQIVDRIPKPAFQFGFIGLLLLTSYFDWQASAPILADRSHEKFPGAAIGYKPKYLISTPEFAVIGKALQRISEPGESIALVPIGAIGYYSEMTVYDMVGLVDPVIAHEPFAKEYIQNSWKPGHDKGDGKYILSLQPTYILLIDRLTLKAEEGVDDWALQYKSIVEIWNSDQFHEDYQYCPFQVNGWYINLYCLKSVSR